MDTLPDEIIAEIFSYLSPYELKHLYRSNDLGLLNILNNLGKYSVHGFIYYYLKNIYGNLTCKKFDKHSFLINFDKHFMVHEYNFSKVPLTFVETHNLDRQYYHAFELLSKMNNLFVFCRVHSLTGYTEIFCMSSRSFLAHSVRDLDYIRLNAKFICLINTYTKLFTEYSYKELY